MHGGTTIFCLFVCSFVCSCFLSRYRSCRSDKLEPTLAILTRGCCVRARDDASGVRMANAKDPTKTERYVVTFYVRYFVYSDLFLAFLLQIPVETTLMHVTWHLNLL